MKEPLPVVVQPRASREIEEIDGWWRSHRPAAANLFVTELQSMLSVVGLMPTLGAPARNARIRGVRRVLLTRTRYHVFYRVRGDVLEVLAVWHAARGMGPGL